MRPLFFVRNDRCFFVNFSELIIKILYNQITEIY